MKRKTIAILLAVAMVATLCMTGSAMAKAKKPSYKLLKSVKVTKYDKDKKKWVTSCNYSFKYNKKNDPVKIIQKYSNGTVTTVNSFKYKNGKKKSMTTKQVSVFSKSGGKVSKETRKGATSTYNKNGYRVSDKFSEKKPDYSYTVTNTYKYKKGYIVLKEYNWLTKYKEGHGKEQGQIKNTIKFQKKGIPSSVITRVKGYTNTKWSDPVYKATFNKEGLYKKYIHVDNKLIFTFKYKYNKQGLVTCVDTTRKDIKSNVVTKTRYTFKYTKKKTNLKRYGNMINQYTMEPKHSFWY